MTMSNTGTQSNSARHEEFQRRMALQQRNREIEARNSVQQRLAEDLGDERPTYGYSWEPIEQVPEMQEFVPGRVSVKEGAPQTAGSSRRQNFAYARENLENLMGATQAPLKEGPSGRRSPPTGEEYYYSGEKAHSPRLDALISQNLSGLSLKEGAGKPAMDKFDDSSNPFADIEEDLNRSHGSYRSPPPPPQLPAPGLTSPPATMPPQHSQIPGYPQSGYPPQQQQYPQSGHPGYPPPPPHLQHPGMMPGYHPQYGYYQPGQQPYQHMPMPTQGGFAQMHQQAEPSRNLQKAPAAGSKSDDFDDDFLDIIKGSTEAAKPKAAPERPKSKDAEQEDKDYAIALLLQEQEEEKYKKEQEEKRKKKEAATTTPKAGSSQPPPRPGIQLSGRVLPNLDFSSPNTIRHEQIRYFAARVVNQAIHYLIPGGQANVGKKVHVVDILEDALLMSGIEGATIYSLEQYEWLVNQVRRIIQPAFMIRNYSSRHVSIDVHEYGIFSSKSLLLKRSYLSARVRNILTAFMTKQRDSNTNWSTS